MERTGVDSTIRPHELGFEEYSKICQSFIEMSREHNLSVTPLRVRKPVAIATMKEDQKDGNADNRQMNKTEDKFQFSAQSHPELMTSRI